MHRLALWGKWLIVGAALLLPACTAYQKHFENSPSDYGSRTEDHEPSGVRTYNTQLKAADHQNNRLEFVRTTTNEVDSLQGIRSSFVFVTDKNAYVAIVLDNTATGTKGKGTIRFSDRTIASHGVDDFTHESNELRSGDVVMDKNSFDTIPNPHDLSTELVAAVTERVRKLHPDIKDVFISANQQFINKLSGYAHDAWKGLPLQPHLGEFNALVQEQFGTDGRIDPNP